MATKLLGTINLARLSNVGIMNIKGKTGTKKCVVIPIDDNDIYIKVEEKTSQQGQKYISKKYSLGVAIYEKREPDQYGNTHYAKVARRLFHWWYACQAWSKGWSNQVYIEIPYKDTTKDIRESNL